MSNTYDLLSKQFGKPCLSLADVREHYFSHIQTDRYLLSQIKAGRIALVVKPAYHGSARAKPVVYLHDLAAFLDAHAAA